MKKEISYRRAAAVDINAEKELNIQKQNIKNYALLHGFKVVEEIKEIGKEQERIRM